MARITPMVDHGGLRVTPDAALVEVGTTAWYHWLEDASIFAYVDDQGSFTARKERRGRDAWYWTAYRKRDGKLHRAYLGKSATLTPERLSAAACALAPQARYAQAGPGISPQRSRDAMVAPPTPILATKLYVPRMRPTLLPRPHLLARLAVGITGSLTLLSAPAGFGKTTLLGAWRATAAGGAVPLAWVSLDAADQDPARFWSYVITALDALQPGVATAALPVLQSMQPPPLEVVLTGMVNALSTLPADSVLVLDDYHVLQSPAIHTGITFLLDHLPPHLHLVIATREDPPLPLARLRARGQLTELRAADLRFAAEEAGTFLRTVMALPLSGADVAALEEHTEGWIAGLHLAALAMRNRSDLASFITAFTGTNRFVLDYLTSEVLDRLPPHLRTFVLQTSILDRLCGPLCEAVVGDQESWTGEMRWSDSVSVHPDGQQHGQSLLEELERMNLFLAPLDDECHWYRYHHLFADVLRERVRRGMAHEGLTALHRRASAWFEAQGLYTEALQHALAAQDWEHAGDLIEQHSRPIALRGEAATVLAWIEALPAPVVAARPLVATIHAAVLMFTNQFRAAETRIREAEHWVELNRPTDQAQLVLGQVAALRAALVRFAGDLPRSVAFAQQSLDLLPATDVIGRAGSLVNAAHAFLVHGELTLAVERAVLAVARPAQESGNLYAILRSFTLLARLRVLQGRLTAAAACYRQGVQAMPNAEAGLHALVGNADYYAGLGDLFREWNDLDGAERLLRQSVALQEGTLSVEAHTVTVTYLALARLQQSRGHPTAALATLQRFLELAREQTYFDRLVRRGAAVQAHVWLMQGEVVAATAWAEASGLHADDPSSYPQEAEYLTLARVHIARRRHDPGYDLMATLGLLDRLLAAAEAGTRTHSVIEILTVQALACQAQGETQAALTKLERALALAAPEGYVRMFVDEAAPMAALLALVTHRRSPVAAYAATLLAAFSDSSPALSRADLAAPDLQAARRQTQHLLVEPLSVREMEILRLIATGHSNQAIADTLIVAVSTVKKHVNNIFSKLDVESRTQALMRARALNLL